MSLPERIRAAVAEVGDDYYQVMQHVWPPEKFPRAYRYASHGGPPGVAMIFGRAIREMGGQDRRAKNGARKVWLPKAT